MDPETKEAVGPNKVGEFAVRMSFGCMLRYLNSPEENKHFFGEDGYMHLGDLGHYDDDGVIYYDGRHKDLIKYKNSHLYPKEIEDLLMKLPGISEAAVFGKPDPLVQELVTAAVVVAAKAELSKEEIEKFVAENVDDHKKLRGGVHFVGELPRNPQGKILRKELLNII